MQIQINEKNEVIGFATLGGFPDGIEPSTVPTGFEENFRPGKYIYALGMVTDNPEYTELPNNEALLEEIELLKAELASSDYKALKFAEGWTSAEDYAVIKAQRQEIRDRINALEVQL